MTPADYKNQDHKKTKQINNTFTSYITTYYSSRYQTLHFNQCLCWRCPLFMQIMWRSWRVQWTPWICRISYTQVCVIVTSQPSNPARGSDCASPPSSPSLPLPGCPSILGPPWEDASPNPNQVTTTFGCMLSLSLNWLVLFETPRNTPFDLL